MKFERGKNIIKQMGIGNTIKDEVENFGFEINGEKYPFRIAMNDPFKDMNRDQLMDPEQTFWVNPHDQDCLHSGSFTAEELREFMRGDLKSKILKGKTQSQRKKYLDYLKFAAWDKDHMAWRVKHYFKWFDQMVTDFNPHNHSGYDRNRIEKRLVLGATRKDQKEEKLRQIRVITSMFAPFVNEIKREFEYREWHHIEHEYRGYFYGIKRTLYSLGVGYMGASNIPEDILNLSWLTDVVYGKAYYLYIKDQIENGAIDMTLPDFAWLSTRAYHGNGEEEKKEEMDF